MSKEIPQATVHSVTNGALTPYIRKLLSLLKPMDVPGLSLVRKGRAFDGGYVMLDYKLESSICYSMGIADDVSWDSDMASMGCQVFQYDHTIKSFPLKHSSFHSFGIGICSQPTSDPNLKTIEELVKINQHEKEDSMIMKMDIEGAEWSVFAEIEESVIAKFSQIIVEMHGLEHAHSTRQLRKYLSVLERINRTHQIVHIHANNHGSLSLISGFPVPDTFEVSLVRRKDHEFSETKKIYPTSIDMPCDAARPDYFLGAMGLY
jgi:hypothetical protein